MGRNLRKYFYTFVLATLLALPGLLVPGIGGVAFTAEPARQAPTLSAIDLPWGG